MDGTLAAAIVTAIGTVVVATVGYLVNRRLGVPDGIQKTIRDERKLYEQTLEAKVTRLEAELATEKAGREADKAECLERLDRLADDLADRSLVVAALQRRVATLEAAQQ